MHLLFRDPMLSEAMHQVQAPLHCKRVATSCSSSVGQPGTYRSSSISWNTCCGSSA